MPDKMLENFGTVLLALLPESDFGKVLYLIIFGVFALVLFGRLELKWIGRGFRWAERIYRESDFGRGIATTVTGVAGLVTYLYWNDFVLAAFAAIIIFPAARISADAIHSQFSRWRERRERRGQTVELFEKLSWEERNVVEGFVWIGGSVVTWGESNRLDHFSVAGIESLINRDLLHRSVTADGMTETFVLDTLLFDYAMKVLQ